MTQEVNDDINDTILEAEENISRISEELGRMKTAAELLDESGKRSQMLQDGVENLVTEISSLVELSGRVIESLKASEVRELVTEMQTALAHQMDGLRTELLENSKSSSEKAGSELQTVLIQHMDSLGTEITARNESAAGRAGAELRGALIQRMDIMEKKITIGTETAIEQVGAELRGALVQRMDSLENEIVTESKSSAKQVGKEVTDVNEDISKSLKALDSQVAEVRKLTEKLSKRKGIIF